MTLLNDQCELYGPVPAWRPGFEEEDVNYQELVRSMGVPGVDHPVIETDADEAEDDLSDEERAEKYEVEEMPDEPELVWDRTENEPAHYADAFKDAALRIEIGDRAYEALTGEECR